jgi:glyoxylase I family protein
MERVIGVGGFFFRAGDPQALARWYEANLGIPVFPATDEWWMQRGGPTVVAPFEAETDYFGRAEQQTMINFRVLDLDAMRAQLMAAGATVSDDISRGHLWPLLLGHGSRGQSLRAVGTVARDPSRRVSGVRHDCACEPDDDVSLHGRRGIDAAPAAARPRALRRRAHGAVAIAARRFRRARRRGSGHARRFVPRRIPERGRRRHGGSGGAAGPRPAPLAGRASSCALASASTPARRRRTTDGTSGSPSIELRASARSPTAARCCCRPRRGSWSRTSSAPRSRSETSAWCSSRISTARSGSHRSKPRGFTESFLR